MKYEIFQATFLRKLSVAYLLSISLAFIPLSAAAASQSVRIYIDADRVGTHAAGLAIEQGIQTALREVGNRLDGRDVEVVVKDHRGNSRRSKRHLDQYLEDEQALVVFAGLHSPPLLANREFINKNRILVLDPWAAAGPITRYPSKENWIFRLSIDDTKAGYVIAGRAVEEGFKKPYLLLEDTGWGRSNEKTMTTALEQLDVEPAGIEWFNWNLGEQAARIKLRKIINAGADVIFLVANAPEGKTFAKAMVSLPQAQRLPIRSHWGITGGDFPSVINADMRRHLDLKFIQTRFSFVSTPDDEFGRQVFARAKQLYPSLIKTENDIKAPTGFIHAYDLTRVLIAAIDQAGLTGDILQDRKRLRAVLENLHTPVRGLVKTYVRPFRPFDDRHPDAHEALSVEDFVMARYGKDGEIILDK